MKNLNFRISLSFAIAIFSWIVPAYLYNVSSVIDQTLSPVSEKIEKVVAADLKLPEFIADDLIQTAVLLDNPVVRVEVPWQESLALIMQTQDRIDSARIALLYSGSLIVQEQIDLAINLSHKEIQSDLALAKNYAMPIVSSQLDQVGTAMDKVSVRIASLMKNVSIEESGLALSQETSGKVLGAFKTTSLKEKIKQFFTSTSNEPLTFGQVTLGATEVQTHVSFEGQYTTGPLVMLMPMGRVALNEDFKYAITNLNNEGFDINLNKEAGEPVTFNWQVLKTQ